MQTPIRLENIHKAFKNGREQVLRGLNLEIPEGELTFVLGPSGSGKSVLLRHILGLLSPDKGKVWVDGQDISTHRRLDLVRYRQKFGVLFQNAALFDSLTVEENVSFPLAEHTDMTKKEIAREVGETLESVGIAKSSFTKFPNELSGGMKKRVGLARAIIRKPSILLYDEPTTGLDPVSRMKVDELIESMKNRLKLTSVVVSHDMHAALKLADRIAFLSDGKAAFWGTSAELRKSDHPVVRSFLDAEKEAAREFIS